MQWLVAQSRIVEDVVTMLARRAKQAGLTLLEVPSMKVRRAQRKLSHTLPLSQATYSGHTLLSE